MAPKNRLAMFDKNGYRLKLWNCGLSGIEMVQLQTVGVRSVGWYIVCVELRMSSFIRPILSSRREWAEVPAYTTGSSGVTLTQPLGGTMSINAQLVGKLPHKACTSTSTI